MEQGFGDRKHLWVLVMLAMVVSCSGGSRSGGDVSEGEIIYQVSYPEMDPKGSLVMMLPDELKITFKENKMKTSFKTAAGVLRMDVISDADAYEMINTIEIFGDQYAVVIDSSADYRLGRSLGNFKAEKTEEVVELAGKKVRKVNLYFEGEDDPKTIFVSDEFDVVDPNWATIYGSIQGMLMEYEIEHYDILMHLKAADIRLKEIDDSEFIVDEDCKMMSQEEFDAFVRSNLSILLDDL
ncbi:MAG: hypothetical protein RLP15_13960 [Cryomorphaceae bacterium]